MGFGTLGQPDITITDMEILTAVGSPSFGSDDKGGNAVIADGAGARVYGSALIASASSLKCTIAMLVKYQAGGTMYISTTGATLTHDPLSFFINTSGKVSVLLRSQPSATSINISASGSLPTAIDDGTPYLVVVTFDVRSTTVGDYDLDIYLGALGGTMYKTSTASSVSMPTSTNALGQTNYLATGTGSFPSSNGSWVGQVRSFQEKFATADDVDAINTEYDTGNFGAESSKSNPLHPNTTMLKDGTMLTSGAMMPNNALMKV
jgi:hypothetical protein